MIFLNKRVELWHINNSKNMEGPKVAEKDVPTSESREVLDREEKIKRAQMSVREMFDKGMEAMGTITSFEYPRN